MNELKDIIMDDNQSMVEDQVKGTFESDYLEKMELLENYLQLCNPPKRLEKASAQDVWLFFVRKWFPQEILLTFEHTVYYLASFKRFFNRLWENGKISKELFFEISPLLKNSGRVFQFVSKYHEDIW